MRRRMRDHPVLTGGVILVLVGGGIAAALLGRGILLWMVWAGVAVAAVVSFIGFPEDPPEEG